MSKTEIEYRFNASVTAEEFQDLLNRSTLGERRPVEDLDCLKGMLDHANLLITAHSNRELIGIARSVTDFCYACYLSDLAVDRDFQRRGIGKMLIAETKAKLGPKCNLILLAAPKASEYYEPLGFEQHSRCWILAGNKTIVK